MTSLQQERLEPIQDSIDTETCQATNPRESGGLFLPDYETGIDSSEITRSPELDCKYGEFWVHRSTMSDGTKYENIIGIPTQKNIGRAAIFTVAWFSNHTAGYNFETARDAMKVGFTPILCSAELNSSIPLSHSAHNMHRNFNDTASMEAFNGQEPIVLGDSRGAMIGMGYIAYANQNKIEVPHSFMVDPCIAKKLLPIKPKEVLEYATHSMEPYSLARQIGRLSLTQSRHYLKTISPKLKWLAQQMRVGLPLFSGETGDFGRTISEDQSLDIVLFTQSAANHTTEWQEIFKDHDYVSLIMRRGTHLSIVNQRTRKLRQQFLTDYAQQLESP